MTTLYRLHSRLSSVCPMMVQPEQSPEGDADPSAAASAPGPSVRIGELSRRTGVRAETIRAWERRYDLVQPDAEHGRVSPLLPRRRGTGSRDARPARRGSRCGRGRETGAIGARCGRRIRALARRRGGSPLRGAGGVRRGSRERRSRSSAGRVLTRRLHRLRRAAGDGGDRQPLGQGQASVAQEHFAASVVRGRLLAISRGWGSGMGPLALLACPPGEHHDIGLIAFGLSLRGRGWRIVYLGQDTPLDTLAETVRRLAPAVVVMSVATRRASRLSRFRARRGGGPRPRVGRRRRGQRGDALPGRRASSRGAANRGRSPPGGGFEFEPAEAVPPWYRLLCPMRPDRRRAGTAGTRGTPRDTSTAIAARLGPDSYAAKRTRSTIRAW